jgi:hypothetical protein
MKHVNSNQHEQIYRQLSKKFNIHFDVVEKVCRTQIEFVVRVMEKGGKESIRLKYLGIFGVKTGRELYVKVKDGKERSKEEVPPTAEDPK